MLFAYCKSSAVEAKRRLIFVALRGNKKDTVSRA